MNVGVTYVKGNRLHGLLILLSFLILFGCKKDAPTSVEQYKQFVLGGFSQDGYKLALSYCTTRSVCKTGLFDLRQKVFTEITPLDKDHFYIPGGFSPNGTHLGVAVRRNSDNGRDTQIALLEFATGKLSALTTSPGYRSAPSFSHDGKKLIFAQANRKRESGKTRFSDWDIYELDSNGKNERRLTAFEFFSVTPPVYLPDDQRFIFSGDGPHAYVSPSGERGYKAYKAKYHDNNIFLLPPTGLQLLEPIFTKDDYSSFPVISQDGSRLVYTAMTNKLDGIKTRFTYDLFLFDGKEHKRLTRLDSLISDTVFSRDGTSVALVTQPHGSLSIRELKLLCVDNGQIEPIDPARLSERNNTSLESKRRRP